MRQYKITEIINGNGQKKYYAYVKKGWFWHYIDCAGYLHFIEPYCGFKCDNKEQAMDAIEKYQNRENAKQIRQMYTRFFTDNELTKKPAKPRHAGTEKQKPGGQISYVCVWINPVSCQIESEVLLEQVLLPYTVSTPWG